MPTYNFRQIGKAVYIIYHHGTARDIATKISVEPGHFNKNGKEGQWFIKGCPDRDNLNIILQQKLDTLRSHANRYFQEKRDYPAPEQLVGFFNPEKVKSESFAILWNNFCRYQSIKESRRVGEARLRSYTSTYNHIIAYDPDIKVADFTFDGFYTPFKKYLRLDLEIGANSIVKYMQVIKTFLKWAIDAGHTALTEKELKLFLLKGEETDIIFHEAWELQKLLDVDYTSQPHLETTHDDYMLQCFTGLRHSDIGVRWMDSGDFLRLKTTKTGEDVVIPVRPEVRFILDKYKGRPFPTLRNAPYNRNIKELGRLAELTQEIVMVKGKQKHKAGDVKSKYEIMTSHVGRATFICSMIEANVHYKKIMAMTGIKKVETLNHYAAVVDRSLTMAMEDVVKRQGLRVTHLAERKNDAA